MKDRRLMFHVHGRKFFLAPPRRPGGPYYIRFEPPSNCRKGVRVVPRSLRTNVIAAAKERAMGDRRKAEKQIRLRNDRRLNRAISRKRPRSAWHDSKQHQRH